MIPRSETIFPSLSDAPPLPCAFDAARGIAEPWDKPTGTAERLPATGDERAPEMRAGLASVEEARNRLRGEAVQR